MWRKEDMDKEEVELKQAVEESRGTQSLRSFATSIGSDASYISQVCSNLRPPSDKLLAKLGLERRVIYVRKKRRWK